MVWSCPVCTFDNQDSSTKCEICKIPKPLPPPKSDNKEIIKRLCDIWCVPKKTGCKEGRHTKNCRPITFDETLRNEDKYDINIHLIKIGCDIEIFGMDMCFEIASVYGYTKERLRELLFNYLKHLEENKKQ